MAAEKKNILTYEGLKKLEDELEDLKVVRRKEVADKIKEAREQGDLSENAEYDAAKDEQREIEARIEELEKILKNAEVVDEDEVDVDTINIGCKVKVLDMEYDEVVARNIGGKRLGVSAVWMADRWKHDRTGGYAFCSLPLHWLDGRYEWMRRY